MLGKDGLFRSYYRQKLAVVIGGTQGIGLATAVELTRRSADVVVASRERSHLDQARQQLEAFRTSDKQILDTIPIDSVNFQTTTTQLQSLMNRYRTPDILVNSAGLAYPGYFEDQDIGLLREMMELNYFGTVHAIKTVLPAMRQARQGYIVNVSSMAGYLGLFGYAGYCASKYAVIGFSDALRREVKPYGIHVSVVCPPNTRTPGLEKENRIKPPEILAVENKVKTLNAEDVARAIVQALPKHPLLIHPTRDAYLVYMTSRLVPGSVMDHFLKRPLNNPH